MSTAALPEAYAQPFTAQSDLALLKQDGVEVHRINVNAFNPHRDVASFTCRHAVQTAPAFSAESQQLNEQALALTSPSLWPNERNYPVAMQLWKQAMDMGNWKAGLNWIQMARTGPGVNSEKGNFQVPRFSQREVLAATNALARMGVADAFYWIGDYYISGDGVKRDSTRAWGFYEIAADRGSAKAQTQLASVLVLGKREQEEPGTFEFANIPYQAALLECAHAQGYGKASFKLGLTLDISAKHSDQRLSIYPTPETQYRRALQVLQEGTKYGNEDSAGYLFGAFDDGDPLVQNIVDKMRARRYKTLADALFNNPDLRFPNLDAVLPLPPAKLPPWDGRPESLIEKAQGVRLQSQPSKPAVSGQRGRANIPAGHSLVLPPEHARYAQASISGFNGVFRPQGALEGLARAPLAGYYQPRHVRSGQPDSFGGDVGEAQRWHALQGVPPLYFAQGETMHLHGSTANDYWFEKDADHASVVWTLVGTAQAMPAGSLTDWLAHSGVLRSIEATGNNSCLSAQPCPQTGIWQPYILNPEHPLAATFGDSLTSEGWRRQAFVQAGQPMPSLAKLLGTALGDEDDAQVMWQLMQATGSGA